MDLSDPEYVRKKLIVSFLPGQEQRIPGLDLNSLGVVSCPSTRNPEKNCRYSCHIVCCVFFLSKLKVLTANKTCVESILRRSSY